MRPARKGPENVDGGGGQRAAAVASMRPARKGPENLPLPGLPGGAAGGFNEAGPQGAGKPERTE